jgi:ribonuclease Z
MRIFISHLHGDHLFGLPGMLHSLSFMGRTRELEIYGPKGIVDFVSSVNRVVKFYSRFPLRVIEVKTGLVVSDDEYNVRSAQAKHGISCLAYSIEEKPRPGKFDPAKARKLGVPEGPLWKKLQTSSCVKISGRKIFSRNIVGAPRKGVKITYAVDTRPCSSVIRLAKNSDLLIHDSSFEKAAAQKAVEYGHSTSTEAAQVAVKCRARKLALFHISAMYENATPLLVQAKRIFKNTILAQDLAIVYVGRNR